HLSSTIFPYTTLFRSLSKRLDVCFAVRIEEFFAPFLPCRFKFGRCDLPVRPAFPNNGTQILAEVLDCGAAEVPVAVVDPVNDQTDRKSKRLNSSHLVI